MKKTKEKIAKSLACEKGMTVKYTTQKMEMSIQSIHPQIPF